MDIRDVVLRLSGRPSLGDRAALLDGRAALHEQCPEMGEGRLVTIASCDRHGQAVGGNLSGETDHPTRGRTHDVRAAERNVHAAVLPARVLVVRDRELA
jgi:hypothetical protein